MVQLLKIQIWVTKRERKNQAYNILAKLCNQSPERQGCRAVGIEPRFNRVEVGVSYKHSIRICKTVNKGENSQSWYFQKTYYIDFYPLASCKVQAVILLQLSGLGKKIHNAKWKCHRLENQFSTGESQYQNISWINDEPWLWEQRKLIASTQIHRTSNYIIFCFPHWNSTKANKPLLTFLRL